MSTDTKQVGDFREKGEHKRIRTEIPLLTSLTPYHLAKLAQNPGAPMQEHLCLSVCLPVSVSVFFSSSLSLCIYMGPSPDASRLGLQAKALMHQPSVLAAWLRTARTDLMRFKFSVALRPQRSYGLLGTGSPGWPPPLSHSSWALEHCASSSSMLF